jgi:hypothetical protein
MGIFDIFLLFSFFLVLAGLAGILMAGLARKGAIAARLALGLAVYVVLYTLLLVGASLLAPQKVIPMHQDRCFDDWCVSVEQATRQGSIGVSQAQGEYWLVTLLVSSRARGITQRARDAAVYVLDERGTHYEPSSRGRQALEVAGQARLPLDSLVEAGGNFTSTVVFDLPAEVQMPGLVQTHGAFPGLIVIGDDQSWLHRPAVTPLVAGAGKQLPKSP